MFADQNTAPWGRRVDMTHIPAQNVLLDGKPAAALAAGRWLAVPSGQHTVSFLPDPRSGFGPRSEVVRVASGAHIAKQMLLPLALSASLPPAPLTSAAAPARAGIGWYTVSGWITLTAQAPDQKPELIQAAALWIKVDGKPVPPLALGQWAALPAGTHTVTFQPLPGLGVGPKTWAIDLTPQTHLSQQVPLPPVPLPSIPLHLRNP